MKQPKHTLFRILKHNKSIILTIFIIVSFRSPSLFYLLVHSRCRGFCFSLDHTQTHITVGRATLDEGSARRRDLYLTKQTLTTDKHPCPRWDSNQRSQQAFGRRPTP
jgi:hypothetical protein